MVSLGEELKRERELREISLREISEATKISIRILEAIEKNNFQALPGGIFNRNFLRAYAEFIGIDSENVVRKYHQQFDTPGGHLAPTPGMAIAFQEPTETKSSKTLQIILMLILLVMAAAFLFFNRHRFLPRTELNNRIHNFYYAFLADTDYSGRA
ncbi:helix-turn-helix domain-containing protein [bacterium]|nr:helix-turn-helix domain-containing protein [bacterium]MCI0613440.1 helix-turn-helix domain-containing protein [bacterium]